MFAFVYAHNCKPCVCRFVWLWLGHFSQSTSLRPGMSYIIRVFVCGTVRLHPHRYILDINTSYVLRICKVSKPLLSYWTSQTETLEMLLDTFAFENLSVLVWTGRSGDIQKQWCRGQLLLGRQTVSEGFVFIRCNNSAGKQGLDNIGYQTIRSRITTLVYVPPPPMWHLTTSINAEELYLMHGPRRQTLAWMFRTLCCCESIWLTISYCFSSCVKQYKTV